MGVLQWGTTILVILPVADMARLMIMTSIMMTADTPTTADTHPTTTTLKTAGTMEIDGRTAGNTLSIMYF